MEKLIKYMDLKEVIDFNEWNSLFFAIFVWEPLDLPLKLYVKLANT